MKFFKEFKEFAMRGNVIDLAVGVVIGGAFSAIITALVENIFLPLIGLIVGGTDISALAVKVGTASLAYGAFLQAIINFLLIALCLFLFVKAVNKMRKSKEEEPAPEPRKCPYCLSEIPDEATRCPHCTSMLDAAESKE